MFLGSASLLLCTQHLSLLRTPHPWLSTESCAWDTQALWSTPNCLKNLKGKFISSSSATLNTEQSLLLCLPQTSWQQQHLAYQLGLYKFASSASPREWAVLDFCCDSQLADKLYHLTMTSPPPSSASPCPSSISWIAEDSWVASFSQNCNYVILLLHQPAWYWSAVHHMTSCDIPNMLCSMHPDVYHRSGSITYIQIYNTDPDVQIKYPDVYRIPLDI